MFCVLISSEGFGLMLLNLNDLRNVLICGSFIFSFRWMVVRFYECVSVLIIGSMLWVWLLLLCGFYIVLLGWCMLIGLLFSSVLRF